MPAAMTTCLDPAALESSLESFGPEPEDGVPQTSGTGTT